MLFWLEWWSFSDEIAGGRPLQTQILDRFSGTVIVDCTLTSSRPGTSDTSKRSLVAKGDLYREESGMLFGSVPWWLRKRLSFISALHQMLVAADKVVWAPVVLVIGARWGDGRLKREHTTPTTLTFLH